MCGIFGLIISPQANVTHENVRHRLENLFLYSESRGKESAGLHIGGSGLPKNWTLKGAIPASEFIRDKTFETVLEDALKPALIHNTNYENKPLILMAHSRLVTNGSSETLENNQPVTSDHVTAIHNGIIVNVDDLWNDHPHLERHSGVDTEIFTALISDHLKKGISPIPATQKVFQSIQGAASVAWTSNNSNTAILATNTGDLYYHTDNDKGIISFSSENYILMKALTDKKVNALSNQTSSIEWLPSGEGLAIDLTCLSIKNFSLKGVAQTSLEAQENIPTVEFETIQIGTPAKPNLITSNANESLIRYNENAIKKLKRCTKCILPETFPFIKYDNDGVCNYCHGYQTKYKNLDPDTAKKSFIQSLEKYKSTTDQPDVIVAFSGGRDSSYGLHLIKDEFGLNPITFTYDWGMVTDLARRNIARICGQLGIQNILVSADIKQKRANIRKNVSAWLKKPDLGMIPLFMAGDKHFFSVVNQIKKQTGIKLDLWSANPLENTDFKTGFCGISPDFDKSRVDYLSFGRKASLATYYMKNFLGNPGYINESLFDTAGAFFSYYIEPRRDFFFIFDHMVWDETEVDDVLIKQYDWELAPDSSSTWRIGDGTAPFYNYIYNTARGFSEFDTFRSNQIREGMITREKALESIMQENYPRIESMRWYLDTIHLDFNETIKRVNQLDTLGLHGHSL